LSASQTYYWNVVAKNSSGSAPASSTWSFTTSASGGGPTWYNSSWSYRKAITIDHTKVAAAATNFPALVVDFERFELRGVSAIERQRHSVYGFGWRDEVEPRD